MLNFFSKWKWHPPSIVKTMSYHDKTNKNKQTNPDTIENCKESKNLLHSYPLAFPPKLLSYVLMVFFEV